MAVRFSPRPPLVSGHRLYDSWFLLKDLSFPVGETRPPVGQAPQWTAARARRVEAERGMALAARTLIGDLVDLESDQIGRSGPIGRYDRSSNAFLAVPRIEVDAGRAVVTHRRNMQDLAFGRDLLVDPHSEDSGREFLTRAEIAKTLQ